MYRLTMYKYRLSIIYLVCKLFIVSHCFNRNSTSWSAINLLVDSREYRHGYTDAVQTTETFGIIIKSNNSVTEPSNSLWTKVQVSQPPQKASSKFNTSQLTSKFHATLGNRFSVTKPPVKTESSTDTTFEASLVDDLMDWANRSLNYLNATTTEVPRKKISDEEKGHAFFDDDDFDDDDDDDYEDEDEYEDEEYNKKGNEDIEEVDETDPSVEGPADAAEAEAQEEYDNYAETRPPIVLRTRRKNKRKRGKKHGHIKIKHFKKLKKFMLPLLLAYKLKFFTLVPLLLGGLVLIVATTGFAGFFFALFAVGLGLKTGHH